ncbi:MAG: M23 family metallopeptidase [Bryobacterales bacterium]|nr:M23 family metallopeptidase [Bryobacterales bacterium]
MRNKRDDARYPGGNPAVSYGDNLPSSQVPAKQPLKSSAGGAYGMVRDDGKRAHQGWDLYAPTGTPVFAIANGVIQTVDEQSGYGLCVTMEFQHGIRRLFAFYAHLMSATVTPGQVVIEGDVIARSGQTDAAKQPAHLHFEIRTLPSIPRGQGLTGRLDPGEVLGYNFQR